MALIDELKEKRDEVQRDLAADQLTIVRWNERVEKHLRTIADLDKAISALTPPQKEDGALLDDQQSVTTESNSLEGGAKALREFMLRDGAMLNVIGEFPSIDLKGKRLEYLLRDGTILQGYYGVHEIGSYFFDSLGCMSPSRDANDDIIAYRIIEPATEAERIGSDSLTTDDDRVEPPPVENATEEGDEASAGVEVIPEVENNLGGPAEFVRFADGVCTLSEDAVIQILYLDGSMSEPTTNSPAIWIPEGARGYYIHGVLADFATRGRNDRIEGKTRDQNPFKLYSLAWQHWLNSWIIADSELVASTPEASRTTAPEPVETDARTEQQSNDLLTREAQGIYAPGSSMFTPKENQPDPFEEKLPEEAS